MPSLSDISRMRLSTCDKRLQDLVLKAIEVTDFAVICGHRTKEEQDRCVAEGKSKTPWPASRHNSFPSQAVDLAPFPVDWNDRERFVYLAGVVIGLAHILGIPLRWGGDWNRNSITRDERFHDLPHFEIYTP